MSLATLQSQLQQCALPLCTAHDARAVQCKVHHGPRGIVARVMVEAVDQPQLHQGNYSSGITVGTCAAISRDLAALLEAREPWSTKPYNLEVSTPGIERPLLAAEDYQRFQGLHAKIWLTQPAQGQSVIKGTLMTCSQHEVCIQPIKANDPLALPFDHIKKAHLLYTVT